MKFIHLVEYIRSLFFHCSVIFYQYVTIYSPILLSMGIWNILLPLVIMIKASINTFVHSFWCTRACNYSGLYAQEWNSWVKGNLYINSSRNCQTFIPKWFYLFALLPVMYGNAFIFIYYSPMHGNVSLFNLSILMSLKWISFQAQIWDSWLKPMTLQDWGWNLTYFIDMCRHLSASTF